MTATSQSAVADMSNLQLTSLSASELRDVVAALSRALPNTAVAARLSMLDEDTLRRLAFLARKAARTCTRPHPLPDC